MSYDKIIERMFSAGKVKNLVALAKMLDVTPQALSNNKARDVMPAHLVFRFAKLKGLSVDWLLYGTGDMYLHGRKEAS